MDAMTLATMILDPKKVTTELLNKWVQEVDYYCLMDVLMTAICTSPIAIEKWKNGQSVMMNGLEEQAGLY